MQAAASADHLYSILVVEDDDVDREKILRLLKKSDISLKIHEESSAVNALKALQEKEFSCAIIDYHLPDALGSDLIEAINRHKKKPTPIIMISGNNDERVVANVMRDGIFDYLPKRDLEYQQLQKTLEASFAWADNEQQLNEIHTRFSQLAEGLPQLIWTCTPNGDCDFVNKRWCDFTGIKAEQQLGNQWIRQIHPDDQIEFLKSWKKSLKSGNEMLVNIRICRFDGEYRWFDTRATAQKSSDGKVIRWLGSNTDITEIELTRQALINSENRFHAAFDHAPLGMALTDISGTILQINPAFGTLLGIESINKLSTLNIDYFYQETDKVFIAQKINQLNAEKQKNIQFEINLKNNENTIIPILMSIALLNTAKFTFCYLFQIYDLSERKRYEEELKKLAHFDPLTGLGNRLKLHEEIEFLIAQSHRNSTPFAVLFGDLDHFKRINDGLGHEAGDKLLRTVSRRLKKGLRRGDSIARLGGDEFVILLKEVARYESVVAVTEKLINSIKRPIKLSGTTIHIGMSFGIALFPTDGDNAKTLLRNADSALYDAKAKERGSYQLYRKELTEYVHNRLLLDADLRNAIAKKQFELYFQPVIDFDRQAIVSAEALIRWHHPLRGLVPPGDFIPYAQETGLITAIDEWAINEACRLGAICHQQGYPINISVNISARQFQNQLLLNTLSDATNGNKFKPENLIIEITEQLFLENTEHNVKQINEIKTLGYKISLDDFGVGFSSLSYIIRFSPHYLKIDRSFIAKIGEASEHDEMVRAILGLSKIIPMQVVVEGVETSAQNLFLTNLGCHFAQGYLYSRPLKFDSFMELLSAQHQTR
ncbi:MAG TPA: EAL domain-containing protein [Cellvibrio sp.]|nr:EAL domain-containing protein [Cellvibrio sp.]